MQLEQFRYVNEIAKCGSITQAAKNLYIAQPSLTIAVQKLEQELGFSIFARSKKGVQITAKGEEALAYIQQILVLTESLESLSLKDVALAQSMLLPAFPMFFDLLTEPLFHHIKTLYPELDFSVKEQTANSILRDIQNGSLDFAICGHPSPTYEAIISSCKITKSNNINFEILYQDPLVLVLPPSHPLAQKESIHIEDLKSETLLTFSEHLAKHQVPMLEGYPFSFKQTIGIYRQTSIKKAVLMGQGISIMANISACNHSSPAEDQLIIRSIADFHNTYVHYFIYNKRHVFSDLEKSILKTVQKDIYASL